MSSVSLPLHWLNPLIVFSPYLSWNSLQTFSLLILYTPHFIRSDESSKPFDLNRFFRRKGSKLHPAPLIPWVKSPQASSEFSCSCGEDSQIQGKIILLNGHSLLSKNHLQPSMQHDQHITDSLKMRRQSFVNICFSLLFFIWKIRRVIRLRCNEVCEHMTLQLISPTAIAWTDALRSHVLLLVIANRERRNKPNLLDGSRWF